MRADSFDCPTAALLIVIEVALSPWLPAPATCPILELLPLHEVHDGGSSGSDTGHAVGLKLLPHALGWRWSYCHAAASSWLQPELLLLPHALGWTWHKECPISHVWLKTQDESDTPVFSSFMLVLRSWAITFNESKLE